MGTGHHSEDTRPSRQESGDETHEDPGALRVAGRILCLIVPASVFLPFATVERDSGRTTTTHTGFDLMGRPAGVLLTATLVLAVLFFALSFRRRALSTLGRGVGAAVRALLCAVAGLTVVIVTGLNFMFSHMEGRHGLYVAVGAWLGLHLIALTEAGAGLAQARRRCGTSPPPWALVAWVLLAAGMGLAVWRSEPSSAEELAFGLLAGLLVGAPVTLLAGLAAAGWASRRQLPSR